MRVADPRHGRSWMVDRSLANRHRDPRPHEGVSWVGIVAFALILVALLLAVFGGGRGEQADPDYSRPFLGNEL